MAKILLIDSNRTSRQILEHALMLYEHDVVSTHQGDEGITLAVSEAPDLIVMDLNAKGLNSWQAIKILKESSATWLIPVIAMADPSITGQMLLQSGFDTYERKPVSARFVLKKINILLDKVSANFAPHTRVHPARAQGSSMPPATLNAKERVSQAGDCTVAYIDNHPTDSQAMAEIIQGAGYRYANISDALQVIPQLMDCRPQLIFLELALPVANGYELCAQIRRLEIFQDTPIIIVSNHDRIADRLRAKMVGASGFISKPIRPKAILKVLIKQLSQTSPG